ncbi:MAG: DNA polymerase III subunit chi [Steroidobacteraceae bacterium]
MTERVDFYVLNSSTALQRWTFACRLAEKAYLRDLKVVLLAESTADCRSLDDLLWTFAERSFVPHVICAAPPADGPHAPVEITADLDAAAPADLLVNVSNGLPREHDRFGRIAEIVDADEGCRRLGRERFKAYRERKLTVDTSIIP